MQNSQTDQLTSLQQAADIRPPSPTFIDRVVQFFSGLLQALTGKRREKPVPRPLSAPTAGPIDPHTFLDTDEGSGAFGHWKIDADGLPCYDYDMNQRRDVRAYYVNTEGQDRREHWHQIGNDCVTALASNDGTVQVYLANRGGIFLNRSLTGTGDRPTTLLGLINALFRLVIRWYGRLRHAWIRLRTKDLITPRVAAVKVAPAPAVDRDDAEDEYAYGGGFGYLNDGKDTWSTAYRYSPNGADTTRIFGIGYFQTSTAYHDIKQTRRVYAPYGDDPILLDDVEIENKRQTPVDLQYYEYWDVNVHQMQIQWIRTGLAAPFGDGLRLHINDQFDPSMTPLEDPPALRFHQEFREGAFLDGVDRREVDTTPPDVFLANLSAAVADHFVDKAAFFGRGGARNPDAVAGKVPASTGIPALEGPMPYCMVLRHNVHLEPGQKVALRYAFGAVQPKQSLSFVNKYREGDQFKQTLAAWKKQLPYFSTGNDPILQRETTWHAYNLLSATVYSEYFGTPDMTRGHYTPQGSAYLFLHGAEGVPRDQSLYSIPMTYVRPSLARQTLTLLMGLRDADPEGFALPYGYVGNGAVVRNALGFHAYPSDLDLYILMAVSEYIAATGDTDFLDCPISLYRFDGKTKPIPPMPVLDHLRAAMKHLDQIGLGEHKLLTIGDGDWDDAIVIMNVLDPLVHPLQNVGLVDLQYTIKYGESVPNSQMALYVLPLAAAIVETRAPDLAAHMREKASALKDAVWQQWDENKGWFYRAYLRDPQNKKITIGDNHVSLQSQVWPLISGLAAEKNIVPKLMKTIGSKLDDASPTGAMLEEKGQVWPAISQLVTWGYRRTDPRLAWRSLNRHTFAAHATVFPDVWSNIWTGPDGTNSKNTSDAGGTWTSPVTPMTDFPAMNANQDAMALTGLLRVCGIEPSMKGDGLEIMPAAPPDRFVLDTELLRLEVAPGRVAGEYRAVARGNCTLHVHLPEGAANSKASIGGQPVSAPAQGARVIDLPLTFEATQKIPFEVQWQ